MTPVLIGHRGARSLYPENTRAGFVAAMESGVGWFETDVALTRDGVPVLSHDPCLNPDLTRLPSGRWLQRDDIRICTLSYAELQRFDVGRVRPGSRTARRFPLQAAQDGERIPALADALRLSDGVRWTIEIKSFPNRPWLTPPPEAMAAAVAAAVDAAGAAERVVVQSFDWRGPRWLRTRRPDLAYAWLTTRATRAWRGGQARLPWTVLAEGGATWAPQFRELTAAALRKAQGAGLAVVPWTVNAPADLQRLAAMGVDGLITDDPLLARRVLHGERLPAHAACS